MQACAGGVGWDWQQEEGGGLTWIWWRERSQFYVRWRHCNKSVPVPLLDHPFGSVIETAGLIVVQRTYNSGGISIIKLVVLYCLTKDERCMFEKWPGEKLHSICSVTTLTQSGSGNFARSSSYMASKCREKNLHLQARCFQSCKFHDYVRRDPRMQITSSLK